MTRQRSRDGSWTASASCKHTRGRARQAYPVTSGRGLRSPGRVLHHVAVTIGFRVWPGRCSASSSSSSSSSDTLGSSLSDRHVAKMRGRLLSNALFRGSASRRQYGHGATRSLDLRGVFVPIPTPYGKNGEVDYGALAANFQRWEKIPFKGDDLCCYFGNMVISCDMTVSSGGGVERGLEDNFGIDSNEFWKRDGTCWKFLNTSSMCRRRTNSMTVFTFKNNFHMCTL